MHTGEKPNKCNQCNFASSQVDHLRVHLKMHSGEKPNKCNQCNFASSEVHHLSVHLKMHSGEKPNKCNLCDFASSRAGNLKTHLKTHTGDKSNKCSQCDFASTQAIGLRRHLKIHCGDKYNKCNQYDFCSFSFNRGYIWNPILKKSKQMNKNKKKLVKAWKMYGLKKFGPGKLWVGKVLAQNIVIDILAELDHDKKILMLNWTILRKWFFFTPSLPPMGRC